MSWATIRRATEDDKRWLAITEARFRATHGVGEDDLHYCIDYGGRIASARHGYVDDLNAPYLLGLLRRNIRRALRDHRADGIAWGYVGFNDRRGDDHD